MFSAKENECVGFDSKWKVTRVYTENDSQTKEYGMKEIWTSTTSTQEVETQTQNDDNLPQEPLTDIDEEKLVEFLRKVYPSVKRELNEAENSNAFYGNYTFVESDETAEAKILQTINVANADLKNTASRVNALSWNSTGNALAIACSHVHRSWCHHSSQILLYAHDNKNDKFPSVPNKKLQVPSCVSVLRFHTVVPYLLGCGTHTGEILIWNVQHDDGEEVIAKVNAHEESITDMLWMHDVNSQKSIVLATSSLDGCLKLWNFGLTSSVLTVKKVYKIKPPLLAKVGPKKLLSKELTNKVARGVLSFDFSIYLPDLFVVGVEGGLIVQCSTLGTNTLKGSTLDVPIEDPVFKYYEPHEGEIITVRCSPNRRDMFMSTATDGEIRIYMIDQEIPARVIFVEKQLNHVSWVPYQEKLIVGCGERGVIEVFQLIKNRQLDNITTDTVILTNLLQLEVNKHRCNLVAIGNDQGEVQLWNVPWSLFAITK